MAVTARSLSRRVFGHVSMSASVLYYGETEKRNKIIKRQEKEKSERNEKECNNIYYIYLCTLKVGPCFLLFYAFESLVCVGWREKWQREQKIVYLFGASHTHAHTHIQPPGYKRIAQRFSSIYSSPAHYGTPWSEIYLYELNITGIGVSIFRCFTMRYDQSRGWATDEFLWNVLANKQ